MMAQQKGELPDKKIKPRMKFVMYEAYTIFNETVPFVIVYVNKSFIISEGHH